MPAPDDKIDELAQLIARGDSTLGELHKSGPWTWVYCNGRSHSSPPHPDTWKANPD
jgi:hypothetical protein